MTAKEEAPTWGVLFPWLEGGGDHEWVDEPISDDDPNVLARRLAECVEVYRSSPWWIQPLEHGFRVSVNTFNLYDPRLPTRSRNLLLRSARRTGEPALAISADDLSLENQAGPKSIRDLLQWLALVAVEQSRWGGTPQAQMPTPPEPADPSFDPNAEFFLLLKSIVDWRFVSGTADQAVLFGDESGVEFIEELIKRARSAPAASLIVNAHPPVNERLADWFASQPESRRVVLNRRLLATEDRRLPLADIGGLLGVTRERVRQIEGKALKDLGAEIKNDEQLSILQRAVREMVDPVIPKGQLLDAIPSLVWPVEEHTVLDLLAAATEGLSADGDWCAFSRSHQVLETVQHVYRSLSGRNECRIEELVLPPWLEPTSQWLIPWLRECGITVIDEYCVLRDTLAARAYIALSTSGSPMAVEEMPEYVLLGCAESSLRNAIGADERFVRVDNRGSWALVEWGIPEYTSISNEIGRLVDERERVSLDALVAEICQRFDVAESSVRAYASAYPFSVNQGLVTRSDEIRRPRKNWRETKRLYQGTKEWLLRITVTKDHLRGSGFPAPAALAWVLDVPVPGTRAFSSGHGNVMLYSTGMQPHVGSVKSLLDMLGCHEGDEVILGFSEGGTIRAVKIDLPETHGSLPRAAALVGRPGITREDDCLVALREALGLEKSAPLSTTLEAFVNRGDKDVADLLVQWRNSADFNGVQGQAGTGTELSDDAHIEDILDLL